MTLQSETGRLDRVVLRHARDAFESQERIDREWRALGYRGPPDLTAACRESDALAALFEALGVSVAWAPRDGTGIDSVYVRDAALVSDAGALLGRMGKETRRGEPEALGRALDELGIFTSGRIEAPGCLEGGDVLWLDPTTLLVGRGYRTNAEGIRQLRALLPDVDVVEVPLPHWRGPSDVFHLMSMISPVAPDLALVFAPLLPVPLMEELAMREIGLVEVPEEELDTQGCNVLAVAPGVVVALDGNPETRRRLETAGVEVHLYEGSEISAKGSGGPTCLTRPLERGLPTASG